MDQSEVVSAGKGDELRVGSLWLDSTLRLRAFDVALADVFGISVNVLDIGCSIPETIELPVAFRIWISRAVADEGASSRWANDRFVAGISPLIGGGWSVWVVERERLSERTDLLDQVFAALPNPVYYQDMQGRYLGCNAAFEAYARKPRHELIGKVAADVEVREPASSCGTDRRMRGGGRRFGEVRINHVDGSLHDMVFQNAVFLDQSGEEAGTVGVILDLTEQRRREADLKLAASVFENAAEAIAIIDSEPRILKVNHAFTEITGYSAHDVVGKNPSMLGSGVQDVGFYEAMWREIREVGRWSGEVNNRRKNGNVYPGFLSITAARNVEGVVTHYVSVFADISSVVSEGADNGEALLPEQRAASG